MGDRTFYDGADFDPSQLSDTAERKLRKALKLGEMGSMVREDIKDKPYILCAWMLSSLALMSVLGARLAYKMRSPEVRQRFSDAAEKPLNLKFFEQVLKQCPDTGQINVCSKAMFARQKHAVFSNLNHLAEYGMGKLPQSKIVKTAQWLHARITRYPMPTLFNESSGRSSSARGALFALAALSNVDATEIASHLNVRERDMYLQEYATLEA